MPGFIYSELLSSVWLSQYPRFFNMNSIDFDHTGNLLTFLGMIVQSIVSLVRLLRGHLVKHICMLLILLFFVKKKR